MSDEGVVGGTVRVGDEGIKRPEREEGTQRRDSANVHGHVRGQQGRRE